MAYLFNVVDVVRVDPINRFEVVDILVQRLTHPITLTQQN